MGALRALQRGGDPLLEGLEVAWKSLGARRVRWRGTEEETGTALCDGRGARREAELPDGLPGRWWHGGGPERPRLLGPPQLQREPLARADGLAWALTARGARAGSRLWVEADDPDPLRGLPVQALVEALEHLTVLAESRARQAEVQRLSLLGQRAGGVAHDLRNQLNLARLQYRSLQVHEEGPARELEASLAEAAQLCLAFLGARDGGAHPRRPLRELLREEATAAARLAARPGEVQVLAQCPEELAWEADPRPLGRALRNLLLNAIAASPAAGRVTLRARSWGERGLELTVEDGGRGMGPAELRRFLRAGESRGGTGFGTASVLACAEELGAELQVESTPGAGTRVRLRLARAGA